MKHLKENLLVQFSVASFAIMLDSLVKSLCRSN